jgi:hypothetical protein
VLILTFIQKHTLCTPPIFVTDGHLQQSLYLRHIARANLGNQHGGFRRKGSWFLIECWDITSMGYIYVCLESHLQKLKGCFDGLGIYLQ